MIYVFVLIVILLFFVYNYRKSQRRKPRPFPGHWHELAMAYVVYYRNLPGNKQMLFQRRMMEFLSEVYIEGVRLELQDLDKVLIAASAIIPVFGFEEWHYTNLSGILLYPDYFNADMQFNGKAKTRNIGGIVGNGRFEKQMILSKKALYHGFVNQSDKSNTGIHEFVHLLDKLDDFADGIPERLLEHQYTIPWINLIHKEMEAINSDHSDIRKYGGTNAVEFFAVASEYFFERPDLLKKKHPELYNMLVVCFMQNPEA
ncbi:MULTISPECIES: zinc-dependent peptidase [Flavobacteriaceae]|jgi:Mlc titration factor MtfA (ptsG expression regulator)|uniref:Peptidase n=5 Tax=Flagellimonas TaxID=444459 RepID=A0A3A1NKQ8_9FLAO|nr:MULTISPECIES: M90 family metallopeptidase [Allomuricauda]MBC72260.1 peptidase [Allomuricauda sp.]UBZ14459.1 zinc-dependent peptidase [Allomuricauda aquimarina]KAB5483958.1 zinc-dependent peptidase [Allomuricauda hadalis]MBO0355857.1 zinc-dependent peptidase [Allomuricauda aurea]NDV45183.1 peptidase [Allomuricauda sediminis]|tara:strand:- start:4017 stop:4790 length:774 start_codon:yes stop_codon:yes gene_type:complete